MIKVQANASSKLTEEQMQLKYLQFNVIIEKIIYGNSVG